MKQVSTLLFALLTSFFVYAQPANDNCDNAVNLGNAPICPNPTFFTNVNATESNIGMDNFPNCFNGTPQRDVWITFVATAAIENYTITVTGISDGVSPAMTMPQLALYRGECLVDELVLLDCAASGVGESEVSLDVQGLTAGITYFLRINDWSVSATPNAGTFQLCIEENITVSYTIDEGSSAECSGELFDTGGPMGNYGNNENHVFTICPSDPHDCIVFNLLSYNFQNSFNETLTFFDGPSIASPVLATITGGANGGSQGGVCYQVVATSGCLSVLFTSNGNTTFEGFQGEWSCTSDCPQPGALSVNAGPSAADIEAALENPLMDITVTSINCLNSAYGVFANGDQTNLGLGEGLLLTTGRADEVANPASFFANNELGLGGNPELDFLNQQFGNFDFTADACEVEADVFVKTDQLSFDYVFGSEEYKQQFSNFSNDLIGILVSGPGIVGLPGLNGQENLAFLPSGNNTLVQIQTVNATQNWEYFRNNLNSQTISYNGLTSGFLGSPKTLAAQRVVQPCQTYHVKFVIGDTDPFDDSGLFITPSNQGLPNLAVNFQTGIDYLVEGCVNVPASFNITLNEVIDAGTTFEAEISGTATLGQDYIFTLPSTVVFAAGENSLSFPIQPLPDILPEGTETIIITLKKNYGCGEIIVAELTIELKDQLQVQITPDQPTVFVCNGINTAQLSVTGAASYAWTPANIFDNPNSANPLATINATTVATVTGTLGTCTATDQVTLQLVSPQIDVQATGSTQICQGDSVLLTAVNNVNNAGLTWSPLGGISNPQSNSTFVKPSSTTTYTATVTAAANCSASDQVTITVEPFAFPNMVAASTTICQNSSVLLANAVTGTSTTFHWSPETGLDNPNIAGATATPDVTTTYTLTATSLNGTCTKTASVTITVLPADLDIVPEIINLCLGDEVQINATSSTNGVGVVWSPTDSLVVIDPQNVTVNPSVSTWYVATLTTADCVVKDSVLVHVDSLPFNSLIQAIPQKESYCQGEVISLVSENYDFGDFPNIQHQWTPTMGAVSSDTLYNYVINAETTTTYIRTTVNGGCSRMDTIEIIVVPVANITVVPQMPSICAGESVQLTASADQPIDEWSWSPSVGLSCDDCTNPTATPPGTLTYQVQGDFMGCPSFATVTVNVTPGPVFQLNSDTHNCDYESSVLNLVVDPNAGYVWTMEDGMVFSTEAQPEVMPTMTTTYTLTIDNGLCPPVTESITIEVTNDFDITLNSSDVTVCQGNPVLLSATAPLNGAFTWQPGNVANGGTVDANESTVYVVSFTDQHGCFTKSDSFEVTVVPPFVVDSMIAISEDTVVFEGDMIDLEVFTTPASLNGPTYTWLMNGQLLEENTQTGITAEVPQVNMLDSAQFKVTITDEFGCMDMGFVTVLIKNSAFDMPNVFSPNGDQTNDFFLPVKSPNVIMNDFRIWDRWGQLVYNNNDNEQGWDGKYKDKDMPSEVYIYMLNYNEGGVDKVIKGDVTLLR